jgi:hypothetical protein
MELNFSSEAPQQKNFIKKAGRGIGKVGKKILPVAATIVPALRPVAAIVDAIPVRR